MQENVQISEDLFVQDLESGCSYVNFSRRTETITDPETGEVASVIIAGKQFRVHNPASEANIIKQLKEQVIAEIITYDKSENVNCFTVSGERLWLDKETRVGLKLRFDAEKLAGKTETALWGNNRSYPLLIDQAIQMLHALELYASECYDVTAQHICAINAMSTAEEVVNYDFRTGYPARLEFSSGTFCQLWNSDSN